MDITDIIRVQKAVLWEQAKGQLRAMVLVEGQCSAHDPGHSQQRTRWRDANEQIEDFIKSFESEGLHE
jgi:hypothetical protein